MEADADREDHPRFSSRSIPAFVDTGLNVVDVRDVAEGHLLAADRGRPGERYILGAENLTLPANSEPPGRDYREKSAGHASPLCGCVRGGR